MLRNDMRITAGHDELKVWITVTDFINRANDGQHNAAMDGVFCVDAGAHAIKSAIRNRNLLGTRK